MLDRGVYACCEASFLLIFLSLVIDMSNPAAGNYHYDEENKLLICRLWESATNPRTLQLVHTRLGNLFDYCEDSAIGSKIKLLLQMDLVP